MNFRQHFCNTFLWRQLLKRYFQHRLFFKSTFLTTLIRWYVQTIYACNWVIHEMNIKIYKRGIFWFSNNFHINIKKKVRNEIKYRYHFTIRISKCLVLIEIHYLWIYIINDGRDYPQAGTWKENHKLKNRIWKKWKYNYWFFRQ